MQGGTWRRCKLWGGLLSLLAVLGLDAEESVAHTSATPSVRSGVVGSQAAAAAPTPAASEKGMPLEDDEGEMPGGLTPPPLSPVVPHWAGLSVTRGALRDRYGLPLAIEGSVLTTRELRIFRSLKVDLETYCPKLQGRCYPLGGATWHMLGDIRYPQRWASNRNLFLEKLFEPRLLGTAQTVQLPASAPHNQALPGSRPAQPPPWTGPETLMLGSPTQAELHKLWGRDVYTSVDARFQWRVAELLRTTLKRRGLESGAVVVLNPATGEILASVSAPFPEPEKDESGKPVEVRAWVARDNQRYDRTRYVFHPPGSTFKLITAMAALRLDPTNAERTFPCTRLPDEKGRVGILLPGDERPIRDDELDKRPHGNVSLEPGIFHSCNAYFAQLSLYQVGARGLIDTAALFGIEAARPNTVEEVEPTLAQTAFGQAEVLATPMNLATVAATVAHQGVWVRPGWLSHKDPGYQTPDTQRILSEEQAALMARSMRRVVLEGTARDGLKKLKTLPIAGKTGTAEIKHRNSHAWFIGYAPYLEPEQERTEHPVPQLAFAVLLENGGYGGRYAAPLAAKVVTLAHELGLIQSPKPAVSVAVTEAETLTVE